MDKRVEQIIEGLQRLLRVSETSFIAMVTDNSKEFTVDVKDMNGTIYPEVRKVGTIGKKGIVPTPSNGSYVIVSRISNSDDLFVSMYSEIDTLILMGGENGGLCITPTLIQELNKTNQLLTAIVGVINGTPLTQPGGSPSVLQTALKSAISGKTIGDYSNVENKKIRH